MHLKIWHKIMIGITIPSLIAILGGLLSYELISDIKDRQGYVEIADDLKEDILEVRRNEKNFLLYKKDAEARINLHDAISILTLLIDDVSAKVVEDIGQEEFDNLQKSVDKYTGLIDILYANYKKETKVTEKVRAEGRTLEAFVAKGRHSSDLSTSFFLHIRLLEKNYMLFRDRKSFLELNAGLSQIKNITPFCYECAPYAESIHDLFSIYKKSDSYEGLLQSTGQELALISGQIAKREREKISSFLTQTQSLLLAILALLCIIGPLFVYKTSKHIVAPINRLARIAKQVADGDITARAQLIEHDETYSLSLSFNTMLDHLFLTHQSLEKSLELLHDKQTQLIESEKRASLGFLVSGVAHELNNPLNNISLTAETMIEDQEELSPDEIKKYTLDIFSQCERAQHIVENLLDFAGARRSTVMEKQDIISLVKKSANLIANQLRLNDIELRMDMPDDGIHVMGNRSKLEQIFINIIVNAIQAMTPEGSGTLSINVTPDIEQNNVSVNIHNTGPEIPEENLKNIFDPFFTTKPVGSGTGLGLSVSLSLVLEHNGKIEVDSKPGQGTTFSIILPLFKETD
ncbi:MAG TPA: sensor histidine kinase [Nitrospirae bacterium]|nr:sensor histidine kinase [Nitrospirota bacterium]